MKEPAVCKWIIHLNKKARWCWRWSHRERDHPPPSARKENESCLNLNCTRPVMDSRNYSLCHKPGNYNIRVQQTSCMMVPKSLPSNQPQTGAEVSVTTFTMWDLHPETSLPESIMGNETWHNQHDPEDQAWPEPWLLRSRSGPGNAKVGQWQAKGTAAVLCGCSRPVAHWCHWKPRHSDTCNPGRESCNEGW